MVPVIEKDGSDFGREPRAQDSTGSGFLVIPLEFLPVEEVASNTAEPGIETLSVSVIVAVSPSRDSPSSDLCLGVLTTVSVEPSPGVVAELPDIGLKSGSIAEL